MRQRRRPFVGLDETARRVLRGGIDFFKDFPGEAGREELRRLWQKYGDELLAAHPADGTRPHGWWWFSAPRDLRVPIGETLFPTKQRQALLAANLLDAAEAQTARRKIEEWERSGKPMGFFD